MDKNEALCNLWEQFLETRMNLIKHMLVAGDTAAEIQDMIEVTPTHARMLTIHASQEMKDEIRKQNPVVPEEKDARD